ncbi:hypothetical protein IQ266_06035 [filamentous cyanobacterium LEGE 11480]|uniref:C2 domain-containing protein n=1 Tax=Romeriopsis navalis LEGE 11480 TaxID=2777977 RepID=A0A928VMD1_9CYAN|nr:hypothetical protein [Romeriopsis navalis]MBE9029321.1 hypothetical protein [Romeriopsis navalis LEGE 11480]
MKHQCFTAGIQIITTLILSAAPALATSRPGFDSLKPQTLVMESEPNDTRASHISDVSNERFFRFNGKVGGADRQDIRAVRLADYVRRDTPVQLWLSSGREKVYARVFRDTNGNGTIDASDTVIARFGERGAAQQVVFQRQQSYLFEIYTAKRQPVKSPIKYTFGISPVKPSSSRVTVTVINAKALGTFDRKRSGRSSDDADFYTKVNIGTYITGDSPKTFQYAKGRTRTIENNDNPVFNQSFSYRHIGNRSRLMKPVLVEFRLMDADEGSDDAAILSAKSPSCFVRYDPGTNRVYDLDGKVLGQAGENITVRGWINPQTDREEPIKTAALTFRIDYTFQNTNF